MPCEDQITAWFTGPKAENGEAFAATIQRIVQDYHYWRRNYYPEDGVALDSHQRRSNESFTDAFDDRLTELLALLKADFPFYSPRYAAHMIAEQTLPSIAGYFAAMLYNPNNVTREAAPVTVRLELEASQMIARMLGYGEESWAHLASGGTVATLEALWTARTVKFLPLVVQDMRLKLGLPPDREGSPSELLLQSPMEALESLARCFSDLAAARGRFADPEGILAYRQSEWNVSERGLATVCARLGTDLVALVPETAHYCFSKSLEILGIGRQALIPVRVDSDFRMRVDDLEAKLESAQRDGKTVMAVVVVVGSTEEGSVDPVHQVLEVRADRERQGKGSFWLHADAAYGGYLRTVTIPTRLGLGEPRTETKIGGEVREIPLCLPTHYACDALERLGECDSIVVDPHKLGYIPYPAGAVCFKSNLVRPILRQEAQYVEEPSGGLDAERHSSGIGMYILEGSKPGAVAASVWLSHKLIPLDSTGHGILVRSTVRNACELHALLEEHPRFEPGAVAQAIALCPPGSNILCFAFRAAGENASLREVNELNRRIYDRFNVAETNGRRVYDQPFFLSRTTLSSSQYSLETVQGFLERLGVDPEEYGHDGVFLLRAVLMNPWYDEAKKRGRYYLSEMVDELYAEANRLLS